MRNEGQWVVALSEARGGEAIEPSGSQRKREEVTGDFEPDVFFSFLFFFEKQRTLLYDELRILKVDNEHWGQKKKKISVSCLNGCIASMIKDDR